MALVIRCSVAICYQPRSKESKATTGKIPANSKGGSNQSYVHIDSRKRNPVNSGCECDAFQGTSLPVHQNRVILRLLMRPGVWLMLQIMSIRKSYNLWLLMLLWCTRGIYGVGGSLLTMTCSNVCSHGTCYYPVTMGNKATVTCQCYPGWGGEQCSIPCSRPCGHGQCVFVGDQQVCLCQLGFIGPECTLPGYDVVTLLSLARLISTGPHLFTTASPVRKQPDANLFTTPSPAGHAASQPLPSASHSSKTKVIRSESGVSDQVIAAETGGESLPPLVENPREHVERNVEQGSSQCMNNFVCRNGGHCVAGTFGGFRCRCKAPYFGTFCQNTCPQPCLNGGRCLKLRQPESSVSPSNTTFSLSVASYVYRCVCPAEFSGQQCERKLVMP